MKDVKNCLSIVERDSKVIAPCVHLTYFPLAVSKVIGAIITDEDGNDYIDFLGGSSSLNLGCAHPEITKAIIEQAQEGTNFTHVYTYGNKSVSYAEKLVSTFPGGVKAKIAWGNCGSDANDAAVKFARGYTGRQNIIVFQNGYHGNTFLASSMSTCSQNMHKKTGPMLPGIHVFPFFGNTEDDAYVEENATKQIKEAFATYLPPEDVAAVIIEHIQGDAGLLPAHPIFIKKLYELCKKHDILYFSEEVQQGFFRTGKFWSCEHYNVIPDGIVMGKSIGGGLPLSGFMAREEIMNSLPTPAHLFTFGGNVLSSAAGLAAFKVYMSDEFQTHLKSNIELIEKLCDELQSKHPDSIKEIRRVGFQAGVVIKDCAGLKSADACYKTIFRSYEKGLMMVGLSSNVLRIQPPLIIQAEDLKKGFAIIDEALSDMENGTIPDEVYKYRKGW